MKVDARKNEWYPVLEPENPSGQKGLDGKPLTVEIPDELWNRYVNAYKEFRPVLEEVLESIGDFLR